jgi:hypothetical protein
MSDSGSDRDLTKLNTDEFIRQIELDEIADASLITPVNYAHVRPITPQLVYYAIRTRKLQTHTCNCGRRCISIDEADAYYRKVKGPEAWPYSLQKEESDDEPKTDRTDRPEAQDEELDRTDTSAMEE